MKKELLALCIFFSQFLAAQNKLGFGLENLYVNSVGTTKLLIGYSPVESIEMYVAPAIGLFSGGISLFSDFKYNLFATKLVYPGISIGYRHSFANIVTFESSKPEVLERYFLPSRDFINFQTGVNVHLRGKNTSTTKNVLSVNILYSQILVKKEAEYLSEQFSDEGMKGANRRLRSGLGFSLSFISIISIKKRGRG